MLIPRFITTKEGNPATLSSLDREMKAKGFLRTDSSDATEIQWKKGDMELTLAKGKEWRCAIVTCLKEGIKEALGMQFMEEGSAVIVD